MASKAYFSWSGGKDSALALYHAQQYTDFTIACLLTNVNHRYRRISMHGVREALLEAQADAIGLPLRKLILPDEPSMEDYEARMMEMTKGLQEEGFTHALYGDIFLEDLKLYREAQLARVGCTALFPLWKRDTTELMHEFIDLGFKTIIVCTNSTVLDNSFAGRIMDKDLLKDLPKNIDPCGENGEFHTFVFDGPIFKRPVPFTIGEKVTRTYNAPNKDKDQCFTNPTSSPATIGFCFCDLISK